MLKITNAAGKVLEIPDSTVITVEKNNPLFNDSESFFQDISYPFLAPFTDSNKIFFQNGHLIETQKDFYELPVRYSSDEILLAEGNMRYRVGTKGYEANLEPNYAAINKLLKNVRMTELRTEDSDFPLSSPAVFEARMLDSCINPEKYPYVFFPVSNPMMLEFVDTSINKSFPWVNYFDIPTQKFYARPIGADPGYFFFLAFTPYWKLTYALKVISEYLGFSIKGGFYTSKETNKLCIYSRVSGDLLGNQTFPYYMPNMLISDFLKQSRNRKHLSLNFDLRRKELTIETFKTIKNKSDAIDLSKYILVGTEQEIPKQRGFTVTLKSDDQDDNFKVVDANNGDTYPPLYTLVAGNGEEPEEFECSTVKYADTSTPGVPGAKYPVVKQTLFNPAFYNGGTPADMSYSDEADPTTLTPFPLRLIRYEGYQPIAGGKFYPCAVADDLDEDDIDFYRFKNDSKRLIISAAMPPSILADLPVTEKYCHRTDGNNYVYYIIEKIVYDSKANTEVFPVKIYAYTLSYQVNTKVTIFPKAPSATIGPGKFRIARIKAYFDPAIHGISALTVRFFGPSGEFYHADPVTIPTNEKGVGGEAVFIMAEGSLPDFLPFEFRVYQGSPKYLLYGGKRTYFVNNGTYSAVTVNVWSAIVYDTYTIFF
jgi:hypothetical protein